MDTNEPSDQNPDVISFPQSNDIRNNGEDSNIIPNGLHIKTKESDDCDKAVRNSFMVTACDKKNVPATSRESINKFPLLENSRCRATNGIKNILKVAYMLHFVPRLFLLVIFSGYDTKCALYEKMSMVNCSQEFLVPEPKYWCYAWLITSTCSSAIVILLVWLYHKRINYSFNNSMHKLIRKASFWRMNFFLSVVFIEYSIAWKSSDTLHTILYVCFLARWFTTALVIYCLNYVNPSRIILEQKMCYKVGYWLTLAMYFAECTCILLMFLINSSLILPPVVDHSGGVYQPFILIAFGFKVALSSQYLTFFLEKIFHGDKDLFSEPGDPVEISSQD